jgi:hypothetical protein
MSETHIRVPYSSRPDITHEELSELRNEIIRLQATIAKNKPAWHPMTELPREDQTVFAMKVSKNIIVTFVYSNWIRDIFIREYIAWIEMEKILP